MWCANSHEHADLYLLLLWGLHAQTMVCTFSIYNQGTWSHSSLHLNSGHMHCNQTWIHQHCRAEAARACQLRKRTKKTTQAGRSCVAMCFTMVSPLHSNLCVSSCGYTYVAGNTCMGNLSHALATTHAAATISSGNKITLRAH